MKEFAEHFKAIEDARDTLTVYAEYQFVIDQYQAVRIERARKVQAVSQAAKVSVRVRIPDTFEEMLSDYAVNLDRAASLLKIAYAIGNPVDITDRPVGHDIQSLGDGHKRGFALANKQRARDSLMATDFFDECGYMPGVHVSKISVPTWLIPTASMSDAQLTHALETPDWRTLVIASFENPADAVLYKLTVA